MLYNSNVRKERAVVAQSVERFLGKEEVRQFKSAQQLQRRPSMISTVFFFVNKVFLDMVGISIIYYFWSIRE